MESNIDLINQYSAMDGRSLAKAIFDAQVPENVIAALPAQSLYLAMKTNGLHASPEIFELASPEKRKVFLDLDLWQKDQFSQENFFDWLRLPESTENLDILKKLITAIDLKLLALIIYEYVEIHFIEDGSEEPLGPGFTTPDKGRTWLRVNTEDGERYFLLNRFLAFLFEYNIELFYQLIAVPAVTTRTILEEESYQDRERRLLSEGFPDRERIADIHAGLKLETLKKNKITPLTKASKMDIPNITPLNNAGGTDAKIIEFLGCYAERNVAEAELSMIINSALIHFAIPIYEPAEVKDLSSKVKGAINVGLDLASTIYSSPKEIANNVGLTELYSLGLEQLYQLRKQINKMSKETLAADQIFQSYRSYLQEKFPCAPLFFQNDGVIAKDGPELPGGWRAIGSYKEVEALKVIIAKYSSHAGT